MSFQKAALLTAILSTIVPVVAVLIRGRSRRLMTLATVLAAASISLVLFGVLRLIDAGPMSHPTLWVYVLVSSALPLLLTGYIFSQCFGRDHPEAWFRGSRRSFVFLGLVGAALLALVRHPHLVTGYEWGGGRGTIHLGWVGKVYVSYLLFGVVLIGYNLERTYRIAAPESRFRIRLTLFGLFGLLAFATFLLVTGMLYSSVGLGRLVALALPVAFACLAVAYGFLRGAVTDVNAPVSRNVVYSSFTALAAGLFVLAMGAAAQIASLTHWSPDEILIVASIFLALLVGVLLLFSNRFQRRVRRFIDRNFYVNRYDYRSQWTALTENLEDATSRDQILDRAVAFLKEVFVADALTIALRDDATGEIRPARGKGMGGTSEILDRESALYLRLCQERRSLLLDRRKTDLSYIPIYAENGAWLEATASRIVAPLADNGDLMGTVGLARSDDGDPFTYEDVAMLDSVSAHIGAALRTVRLAREVADTREMELMSQWSSMLLHDLKNYLAPLRMAAANLMEYRDNPETALVCAQDVQRVADRMEKLVHTLSELRQDPSRARERFCPNQLVRDAVSGLQVASRPALALELQLDATLPVLGDREMLRRVMENLITNAVEAMSGSGTLTISTLDHQANGSSEVEIRVADTGPGIPEEFLRDRLFRPFATTKKKGLGLGLYQCRSIVRAHGGEMKVHSRVGDGTVFQVSLGAVSTATSGTPVSVPA